MLTRKLSFLIGFGLLILAGCATADVSAPILPLAVSDQSVDPTSQPGEAAAIAATTPPNECVTCHVDQQMLIDTAKPEAPVVESESKGVG